MMANVFDTAEYILSKTESISTWKLQKLVYYAQAWSLVWDDRPLFDSKIEAWANGPVCPDLYQKHRGNFKVSTVRGNSTALDNDEIESVDAVLKFYKKYNGQQLSDLTHREEPWRLARAGLSPRERGGEEISHESMAEYYGAL